MKFEEIKNLAAERAFTEYAKALKELAEREGITNFAEILGEMTHVHEAILIEENGPPVLVKCRWDFTSHPAVVEEAIHRAKAAEVP